MNYSVADYTKSMCKLSTMLAHRQKNSISNKIYLERNIHEKPPKTGSRTTSPSPNSPKSSNPTKKLRKRKLTDLIFPKSSLAKYEKELTVYILGFSTTKMHLLPNDCYLSVQLETSEKLREPCAKRKRASKPAILKRSLVSKIKMPSKNKMKSLNIHNADKFSLPISTLDPKKQHFFVFEIFDSNSERIYVGRHHFNKKSQGDISIYTSKTDKLKDCIGSDLMNPGKVHAMQEFTDSKNKNRHAIQVENFIRDTPNLDTVFDLDDDYKRDVYKDNKEVMPEVDYGLSCFCEGENQEAGISESNKNFDPSIMDISETPSESSQNPIKTCQKIETKTQQKCKNCPSFPTTCLNPKTTKTAPKSPARYHSIQYHLLTNDPLASAIKTKQNIDYNTSPNAKNQKLSEQNNGLGAGESVFKFEAVLRKDRLCLWCAKQFSTVKKLMRHLNCDHFYYVSTLRGINKQGRNILIECTPRFQRQSPFQNRISKLPCDSAVESLAIPFRKVNYRRFPTRKSGFEKVPKRDFYFNSTFFSREVYHQNKADYIFQRFKPNPSNMWDFFIGEHGQAKVLVRGEEVKTGSESGEKGKIKYIQLYSCTTNQPKTIESVELSPDSEDEAGEFVPDDLKMVNGMKRLNRVFDFDGVKHPEQCAVQGSNDPRWARVYSINQISDFDDISRPEFSFIKLWNNFLHAGGWKTATIQTMSAKFMTAIVLRFVRLNLNILRTNFKGKDGDYSTVINHFVNMVDYGKLDPSAVMNAMRVLRDEEKRDHRGLDQEEEDMNGGLDSVDDSIDDIINDSVEKNIDDSMNGSLIESTEQSHKNQITT